MNTALTDAERTAYRDAENALCTGLPLTSETRRHLAAARKKVNLIRYNHTEPFVPRVLAGDDEAVQYY